jgi:hypothetical protein
LLVESQLDLTGYRMPVRKAGFSCKLQWTGKAIEFVELVYALHVAGKIGKTALKEVFSVLCEVFGIEVKNHYRLFWDIKNRVKGSRTIFLNLLKTGMITFMEKSERK